MKNKYFYLVVEPDEKINPSGIAYGPSDVYFTYLDFNENIESWQPMIFKLEEGDYVDFQINNMGWPLCSTRLKSILSKYLTNIDHYKWLQTEIVDSARGNIEDYYILYFSLKPDFLDKQKTVYADREANIILKKFYDLNLIADREVFMFNEKIIVSEKVKKEILKEQCTGIYFYGIHGDSGKLI